MKKRTQCPHCLAVFGINHEKFIKSKGNIRCGKCRKTFRAKLLQDQVTGSSRNVDRINEIKKSLAPSLRHAKKSHGTTNHARSADNSKANAIDGDIQNYGADYLANKKNAQKLIDEIDDLINDKFHSQNPNSYSELSTIVYEREESIPVELDDTDYVYTKRKTPFATKVKYFFFALSLTFVFTLLSVLLLYQLWHKQIFDFPVNKRWETWLIPASEYIDTNLNNYFDVQLPVRRDLNGLELVSARVQPHPDRATTILLKVVILNRSSIQQPYPWLELILMDESGRLVSRRPLSPDDYLHNNRLSNQLKPKQSQKVSIELLAFPQHAQGYEVRLLDK